MATTCRLVLMIVAMVAEERSSVVSEPPPFDDFLVIPLRIHVLTSDEIEEIDCHLSDADVTRILGKVNGIWHPAGIHFALESIVREPAENVEAFKLARLLDASPRAPHNLFRPLRPAASRRFDGLHVYYVHDFDVNGVYMGRDFAFVREMARLREVDGGIDEPIPRVTSHELGHALGLPHREDRTNLLASGTTGTSLNRAEVERARERARTIAGVLPVAELRDRAEKALEVNEPDQARRFWSWLAEIPGDGAEEARRRLEAIVAEGGCP